MAAGRMVQIVIRVDAAQADEAFRRLGYQADATAAQTERAFRRSGGALAATGRGLTSLGRTMTTVGLGLGAVGFFAIKTSMNFQTAMTRIHTQAGQTQATVDSLSRGILQLQKSGQVQYGSTDLANAMYHIQSVGVGTYKTLSQTSVAMGVLKVAAEGAAIGGSNLEDTTSALMGVLFATRAPISQAAKMMALINSTVGAGNLRLNDLVLALGRGVIPAFEAVGLKAKDAFAAIALLSDSGVKASSAAAQLGTALHFLVKPSTEADKYLASIGMTQYQMAEDLHKPHGLLVALRDLREHITKFGGGINSVQAGQTLAALIPGGRGRILLTLIQNLDRYQGKIDHIYGSEAQLHSLYEAQAHTLSGELHIAWSKINGDFTEFGQKLTPIVVKYLPMFVKDIMDLFRWIASWPPSTLQFLTKLTAILVVGGPLLWGLGKLIELYIKLKDVFLLMKAAGAAAFAGESLASGGVTLLMGAMKKFIPILAAYEALQQAPKVTRAVKQGKAGRAAVHGALLGAAAGAGAGALFGPADPITIPLGALIGGIAGGGAGLLSAVTIGRGGLFPGLEHHQGGLIKPIRGFQGGGMAGDNIPAWLSAGEGVLNRTAMAGLGVGGLNAMNNGGFSGAINIQPAPVNVYLDGRLIARSVLQQTLRKAARGPSSLVGGSLATGAAIS